MINILRKFQVAQGQLEQAANMRRRLNNEPIVPLSKPDSNGPSAATDSKKTAAAIAAEVADRLAASTHSQQIMTSVLSSFAAEEAKNATLTTSSNTPSITPKHDNPSPIQVQSIPQAVLVQQTPVHNQQPQYNIFAATTTQQYVQPPSMMVGLPYTYSTVNPPPAPPPPPPPPPQMMSLVRPGSIPPPQQQQMTMIQPPMMMHQPMMTLNQQHPQFGMQQPMQPSYRPLQPPNMGFYPHQAQ